MVSPEAILIAVVIAASIYVGGAVVREGKKIVHGVKHGIAKIVHPHRDEPK